MNNKYFWDEECKQLKKAYTKALELEIHTGQKEDKKETSNKKMNCGK